MAASIPAGKRRGYMALTKGMYGDLETGGTSSTAISLMGGEL